ncbi:MAG: hypothetical protein IJU12_12165 [Clostridia bacterium]|nr:hypothetical protein [Clostridia bacterium]
MNAIPVSRAFGAAPPRRPAVLCIKGPDGSTDMILTQWFSWLNIKRNPMIAYAMETTATIGLNVKDKDEVYLAFPPVKDALRYKGGVRTAYAGKEKKLPEGVVPVTLPQVPVLVPEKTEVLLRCTIAGSYKYPFKKVRIYNCNLEEALAEPREDEIILPEE